MKRTGYEIQYINDDLDFCYYQLVRTVDEAIIRSSRHLDTLIAFCIGRDVEYKLSIL